MLVLRALARLVTVVLLVLLTLGGLAALVFSIDTGDQGLSLGHLAKLLGGPSVRDTIGGFLDDLEASGPVAIAALLGGLGAMLLGLALLLGRLVPARERLVALRTGSEGTIAARRRALGQVGRALVEGTRGVSAARVKVRPGRKSGGRMVVRAAKPRPTGEKEVAEAINDQLQPLTSPFELKLRVVTRSGEPGARVR